MLIGGRASWLNDEDVASANIFLDPHVSLAVRECADGSLPQRHADVIADPLSQLAVGRAAEDLHFWLEREHGEGRYVRRGKPTLANQECAR